MAGFRENWRVFNGSNHGFSGFLGISTFFGGFFQRKWLETGD